MERQEQANPLGSEKIARLLWRFAIPSIIAMLVTSLYNIVDQFFIGHSVGELGNAATNISFPLSISCTGLGLLFGIGGASAFNLSMGEGRKDQAVYYLGNAAVMLFGSGAALCIVTQFFLEPLLLFFGSPDNVLGYARTYTRIIAWGFPFLIFSLGGGHLIRADGRPRLAMACSLAGAVVNTALDSLFVFAFGWGMAGAALATIIGQCISGLLALGFLARCRTVALSRKHLLPQPGHVLHIVSLGTASLTSQLAMMAVQIVMNKSLKYYGALSSYGEAVPLACVGIITKVNMVFMSFVIGISQGLQPIVGFNYGAKKFGRVKEACIKAFSCGFLLALTAFLLFQLVPRQIISIFGSGSEEYYRFAIKYFHIYLFFTFFNFLQPISSTLFTSIGKPKKGMFLSLTRQIFFLLPLLLFFPLLFGIEGVLYAGPVADFAAAVTAAVMIRGEFKRPEYKMQDTRTV